MDVINNTDVFFHFKCDTPSSPPIIIDVKSYDYHKFMLYLKVLLIEYNDIFMENFS